ncbi:CCA tRNA nucleotidyltransferase [Altererythrobacter confluentis]|uniref:CCA tRNA nucleotidyltransferase n=1 Tax=Allopontixanthobacter confluentis TaxID=1849021 RepID=A0A6L7GC46_9SPHN|nr:CCA tRNA nucleotidyltransferase [Allopontixanthobacter confluentis]MXP13553.1 CCA tRNA nucleotidyltransferase [Allopontixanthobacter confluentis]
MADQLPAAPRLPAAQWTQRADLAELVAALGADNVRWVGGAVRDTVLGVDVHDIDAATPLEPQDVINRLEAIGVRTIPTGIDHGTITAIVSGSNVEITTLRHDVSTDGRRATVKYASDWRDDASRRDFTINALYAHPESLEISDYFGGLDDLENRRVRFIGDARQRIREDHLRILRYFRFQTRFGSQLDEDAESACADLAETLKGLSRERVGWELQNLLALPDPSETVARMHKLHVLQVVLPETGKHEIAQLAKLIAAEKAAGLEPDAMRRLAALLPALPPIAAAVTTRLRLSRSQRSRLSCVAGRDMRDSENPQALVYREGKDCAIDRLLLTGADPSVIMGWDAPDLPLKGGEIVRRGVAAGPAVARILHAVETRWLEEGFPDKARVSTILDEELAQE